MKKIFKYMFMCLAVGSSALMTSCSDDDNGAAEGTDRSFMTMFITDNTRGKGSDYPFNCDLDSRYPHGNTIHLYWYGVKDCAGYQIQMALPIKVANGADAWANVQGTPDLLLDTIVAPDCLDMVIENLQYSTDYRFAIRALDKRDANKKGDPNSFAHASNWYGHGNGRQWQEYMNIKTADRYPTPTAIYVNQAQTEKNRMFLYLNTNVLNMVKSFAEALAGSDGTASAAYIAEVDKMLEEKATFTLDDLIKDKFVKLTDEDKDAITSYYENFNVAPDGTLGYQNLQVKPSPNNPDSKVNEKFKNYQITDEDRERGYIIIDGLTENSVYVIDVIDPRVPVDIDAKYNTCTSRSDGTPGEPILLKHDEMLNANIEIIDHPNLKHDEVFALAKEYDAAPISHVLYNFISDTKYAEGQTYLLEGGKTYYLDGNDVTCKGFVLRTDPADVAKGLRAKVICGIGKSSDIYSGTNGEQWQGSYSMFIFGRSPEAGEGGEIYMKKLAFYDIDFDNPTALNEGDVKAGLGAAAGNYFFNMYSNGMAVTLDSLVISNCTFKRLVRGFVREQGPNYKKWNHVLIEDNQFFDCGYYNNGAGGYPWIAAAGTNPETNLYKDFKFVRNTIYDSPFPNFFGEAAQRQDWKGGPWMITFSDNTIVNYNTRANGAIFKMNYMPNGSVYNVENNLLVLTKQEGDARVLNFWGAALSETTMAINADGDLGLITLHFNNNVTTSDNPNTECFSANTWKSAFKKLIDNNCVKNYPNGSDLTPLEIGRLEYSATEIFNQPCPPHKATSSDEQNMHRADALDGSAKEFNVDLRMKKTVKVGDPRWWNNGANVRHRK